MRQIKDKKFYGMILTIGVPIALQNLLVYLTQMLDTIMLGELGDIPLTASSLANQVFFIYSLFTLGIAGGSAVLTAQYWGKKDMEPIRVIMGMVLRLVSVVGIVLSLLVLLFPGQIMRVFTTDAQVIETGIEYLEMIGYMYLFFGFSNTLISMLRSIEMVKVAVIANGSSLVVNAFLNWVLIFGNLGAPRLEIKGAAIATLVAKIAEFAIVLIYVLLIDQHLKLRVRHLFRSDRVLRMDLLKYCTPVVLNELAWALGISMQALLFGRISTIAVSANTIIMVVQQLCTIFIFGIANAGAVIIGKTIGEGNVVLARRRGKRIMILSIMTGVVAALLILLIRNLAVDFYNVSEETKALAKEMLLVTSVIVLFVSTAATAIVGLLRGGGDTQFSLIIEVVALWFFAVPLGFIAGMVLKLPIVVVYLLFKSDEIVKTVICFFRLRGSRWIRNVTRDDIDAELQKEA